LHEKIILLASECQLTFASSGFIDDGRDLSKDLELGLYEHNWKKSTNEKQNELYFDKHKTSGVIKSAELLKYRSS